MKSKEERLYEEYVERGPDAMNPMDVKRVLDWRDRHPAEAFAVREQYEARRREIHDIYRIRLHATASP